MNSNLVNWVCYSYNEIKEILENPYSYAIYGFLDKWFDLDISEGLFYGEGSEIRPGQYWLCNVDKDYAYTVNSIEEIEERKSFDNDRVFS